MPVSGLGNTALAATSAVGGNGGSDSGTMNSTSVMMILASVLQRVGGPTFLVQDEIGVR
jgi:hypothetical protein